MRYNIGDIVRIHYPRWIAGEHVVTHAYRDVDGSDRLQVHGWDGPQVSPNVTLVRRFGAESEVNDG